MSNNAAPSFLLIDYENIRDIEPRAIDGKFRILVFVGPNDKNIPFELVEKTQCLGSRLVWKRMENSGKNAVDSYITYQMGKIFNEAPQAQCVVLSRDTGFDPLIKKLKSEGRNCRRIGNISEVKQTPGSQSQTIKTFESPVP
jgi:hypothetical protein